ncbi:hypothetical protein [Burkholderia vietnamiensis]|nr:hypothetical protein [Burkholderia vietnamiensis]
MKKRFTEQQIIGFLKEAEAGMRISGNVNTCFGEVEQVGREVLRSA